LTPIKNYTDEELIVLLTQNNELAFSELYNRHARRLRGISYAKLNSKEAAQEIVQEIFLNLWERRHSLQIESVSSYFNVSVKNRVINLIKRQSLIKKHAEYYKSLATILSDETEQDIEFSNLYTAFEEGVSKLPEKTQLIFKLSRFEHKSIAEIATELQLSQQAIKYHITQSLKELRLYLKEFIISLALVIGGMF
jgi:RNA polymerase sigma-70 factor (family 1)